MLAESFFVGAHFRRQRGYAALRDTTQQPDGGLDAERDRPTIVIMDDIRSRVRDARRAFFDEHDEAPTCLHLTSSDEHELMTLPATEIGDEAARVMTINGARAAFLRYQGMVTVWDQAETRVGQCHTLPQ